MDHSQFDLQKLKGRTKTHSSWFIELQYADDCALLSHSYEGLQDVISRVAELYTRFGLEINVWTTEVLGWTGKEAEATATDVVVNGTQLQVASSFKYLGTYTANDCKLDSEINNRICQASRALGRMQTRVFKNHNLSLHAKIKVYTAVCLSTGSMFITVANHRRYIQYSHHMKVLEAWHIKGMRCILGITWTGQSYSLRNLSEDWLQEPRESAEEKTYEMDRTCNKDGIRPTAKTNSLWRTVFWYAKGWRAEEAS